MIPIGDWGSCRLPDPFPQIGWLALGLPGWTLLVWEGTMLPSWNPRILKRCVKGNHTSSFVAT